MVSVLNYKAQAEGRGLEEKWVLLTEPFPDSPTRPGSKAPCCPMAFCEWTPASLIEMKYTMLQCPFQSSCIESLVPNLWEMLVSLGGVS